MPFHYEILVEEPSMEAYLVQVLPRLVSGGDSTSVHCYRGKGDLLRKLPDRLSGYSQWIPDNYRIVILIDRDDDDCRELKNRLEQIAFISGLKTRTQSNNEVWSVANRVAIEELEAWFFGDWAAVQAAYPRVSSNIPRQVKYRDSDAITGGTWEAFERILQRGGYHKTGLQKIKAARLIGSATEPERNRSHSFRVFANVFTRPDA